MYTRAVFIASSLLLASGSSSAIAADIYAPSAGGLKDPVYQEEVVIPEATVYQEYAEWYIRADIGVGQFSDLDAPGHVAGSAFKADDFSFDPFFSASLGFGRYITPNIRLGIDVDYRHNTDSTFNVGIPAAVPELENFGTLPLELNSTAVMVNAVYDFMPNRRYSPYLGGGIGWAFHQLSLDGNTFTNDATPGGALETGTVSATSSGSSSFAANLVTGVSVNVRHGLFLDVGYKFSYLGSASMDFNFTHDDITGTQSSTMELDDIMTHEFKIGLRYDLY